MLEIRITAPELSEAINNLAAALDAKRWTEEVNDLVRDNQIGTMIGVRPNSTAAASVEAPVPTEEEIPVDVAPASVVPTAPVAPAPAPKYTLDAIAKAGSALVDAGKIGEVTALLAKYGVDILTSLDPSKYGEFANDLRALGAQL